MADHENNSIALLIDADNVTPTIAGSLLAEIAKYGVANVKRIYGDWTQPNLKRWKSLLLEHSIHPIQQFSYTTGKNSTDGAMIIDAMDLLYTGRFSAFCIASSDSDFARLASRLREQGIKVYGFGERKTPRPFITACDKFTYFDVIETSSIGSSLQPVSNIDSYKPDVLDTSIMQILSIAVLATLDDSGWAHLSSVGAYIAKQSPDFDPRNYGFPRLSDLVKSAANLEVRRIGTRNMIIQVRLKS